MHKDNQKQDPQLRWNLVASVAHEYFDGNVKAFDKLMASFEKDEFYKDDKSKIQKATLVTTDNHPHFGRSNLANFIRFKQITNMPR